MIRELFTFLSPTEIASDEARMLHPDGQIEPVTRIPDWYWKDRVRIVGYCDSNLRGELTLITFFTCREAPDGSQFESIYATRDDPDEWHLLAKTSTLEDARALHAAIRQAWWIGLLPEGETLAVLPEHLRLPAHPADRQE